MAARRYAHRGIIEIEDAPTDALRIDAFVNEEHSGRQNDQEEEGKEKFRKTEEVMRDAVDHREIIIP